MAAQGKLDLDLVHHSIDSAQAIRHGVRHGGQARQRHFEIRERLGIGPAPLSLLAGQQRVVHGLLDIRATTEVVREELDDLARARPVQPLQR